MATAVISQWIPRPKILYPMKYWQMAIHGVSGPEILVTMVKSFVAEQRISGPETFIPYDIVFYGCLQNSSIWKIYSMGDGFVVAKRISRPKMKTCDFYTYAYVKRF